MGGGAGTGGEEKVALGSLESLEVAAAGFASLRARVRGNERESERGASERLPCPADPASPRPGAELAPTPCGPARPAAAPAPRPPRRVLPSPARRPQPPARPGSAPLSRPPLSLPPGRGAAWRSPGSGRAAARRPSEPGSGAAGHLRADPRPAAPSAALVPLRAPWSAAHPWDLCAPRVPSITGDSPLTPGSGDCPQEPRVPLDPDAAPRPPRAPGLLHARRIPGLGQPGCAPW